MNWPHRIGNANASRAVGLANGRNPISIIVPCHRVIGADGSLTGYGGGLERKTWLLEHESTAPFLMLKRTSPAACYISTMATDKKFIDAVDREVSGRSR